jgi:hypothetical protein
VDDSCEVLEQRVLQVQTAGSPLLLCVLAIADLDLVSERQARAELRRTLSTNRFLECELDVSQVFVDVRGLGVLLDAAEWAAVAGGRLTVTPSRSVVTMCRALGPAARLRLVGGPRDPGGSERA